MTRMRETSRWVVVLLAAGVTLAACGGSHSATRTTDAPTTAPSVGLSVRYVPIEFSSPLFWSTSEGDVFTDRGCSFGTVDIGITASAKPRTGGLSVTPQLTFSGGTNGCGLPLPECSSGSLAMSTTHGRLLATVEIVQSTEAEVTNFCLSSRLAPVPFSVQTLAFPLPALPSGSYKFSLSLNGFRAVKRVELPQ